MKVSVIIPTYNRSQLVSLAVRSVLAQTFTDYELIVVDDGSTDGTEAALAPFADRLLYVWQENQGESVARNHGITLAQGEYIAFLDSDDLWAPEKLAVQVPILDENPDIVMVGCASWIIDADGDRKSASPTGAVADARLLTYGALRYKNHFFSPSTAIVRHAVIDRVGGFASEIRYGEEWDLWLRIVREGRIEVLLEPLAYVRQHAATQTAESDVKSIDRRLADYTNILRRNPPTEADGSDSAMARQYLRAAIDDIAIKRLDLARERLDESQRWDRGATILKEGVALAIERALILAQPDFTLDSSIKDFYGSAVEHLFSVVPALANTEGQIWAEMYLALAVMARTTKNWASVRRCLWQALRHDHRAWRSSGFAGSLLESLLGARGFQLLRGIVRKRGLD